MHFMAGAGPPPLLIDVAIVLIVATVTAWALRKVKIPTIIGFMAAGVLIGPGGLDLVHSHRDIETLAEIGVTLLLFTVGLKFSLRDMARMKTATFGVGGVQLALSIGVAAVLSQALGFSWQLGLFLGFLLALSSTALVLRLVEQRGELDSPQGRGMLGVLLLQDLAVIPIMLALPLLSPRGDLSLTSTALAFVKSLAVLGGVALGARIFIPWLLERVVSVRSREIFTLAVLLTAFGAALIVGAFGMSMALGAFLGGMLIAESPYARQIQSEIVTLRDAFSSLFFVTIGMLVRPASFIEQPALLIGLIIAIVIVKAFIVLIAGLVFQRGQRVSWLMALGLAQIGEFSFVVAAAGWKEFALLSTAQFELFLTVAVPTMALTPFLMQFGSATVYRWGWFGGRNWKQNVQNGVDDPDRLEIQDGKMKVANPKLMRDHVIIVGFGPNGRGVARVLRQLKIRYLVLELNPQTVRTMRAEGEPVFYGDACRDEMLRQLGLEKAKALVIASCDPASARQIVGIARAVNKELRIIVRTRYDAEAPELRRLGANDVVVEEYQSAMAMSATVMHAYGAERGQIYEQWQRIEADDYELIRSGESGIPARKDSAAADAGKEPESNENLELMLARLQLAQTASAAQRSPRSALAMKLRRRPGCHQLQLRADLPPVRNTRAASRRYCTRFIQ